MAEWRAVCSRGLTWGLDGLRGKAALEVEALLQNGLGDCGGTRTEGLGREASDSGHGGQRKGSLSKEREASWGRSTRRPSVPLKWVWGEERSGWVVAGDGCHLRRKVLGVCSSDGRRSWRSRMSGLQGGRGECPWNQPLSVASGSQGHQHQSCVFFSVLFPGVSPVG